MDQKHINHPIEVWLLTGYLGAGKTTTLNHLLSHPIFANQKIALVINEFGKMGIDGQLVQPGDYIQYEINKGSLFCICTKTDFIKSFQQIAVQQVDTVLIEATGIAETADLEQLLKEPILKERFKIRANICLIDGVNFIKTAAFLKAAVSQVRWADGLVINKTDQLPEVQIQQVITILKELNPSAKMVRARFGNITSEFLGSLCHRMHERSLLDSPPEEIPTAYFTTDCPVDKDCFFQIIDRYKGHILRLKGDIGFSSGSCFVEVIGNQVIEKPSCGKFQTRTAFTVIGWKLQKQQLEEAFKQCVIREAAVKTNNKQN